MVGVTLAVGGDTSSVQMPGVERKDQGGRGKANV